MASISTRDHIINIAAELFYERSYNLVGINEIIERAEIAKATLYKHFSSKDNLCIAYLDKMDDELNKNIREHSGKYRKGNKRLLAILDFLIPFFEADDFNGCWCIRTMAEVSIGNLQIRHKIKQNKTKFLQLIHSIVVENKPDLSKSAQSKLAKTIYMLYESAVSESHLHNDSWPIHHNIGILKSILNR